MYMLSFMQINNKPVRRKHSITQDGKSFKTFATLIHVYYYLEIFEQFSVYLYNLKAKLCYYWIYFKYMAILQAIFRNNDIGKP